MIPLSGQSMTRGGSHVISAGQFRRMLGWTAATVLLIAALAFGAGILAAGHLRTAEASAPQGTEMPLQASEKERFAAKRLGELFGRLLRLETDAAYLVKKVGDHEAIARKLGDIDPSLVNQKTPPARAFSASAKGGGQGGILLPPRTCGIDSFRQAGEITLQYIARLETSIDCLQRLFDQMDDVVALRNADLMAIPSLQPIENAKVGSRFGNRSDPFHGQLAFHSGLDFAAPTGTPIHAAAGGRVVSAGWRGPYGNMVEIDHGNGLVTRYAHTSKMSVQANDVVMPGQLIAAVGSTGRSTGPHLHFEVLYRGEFVDPQAFMSLGNMELAANDLVQD